MRNVVSTCANIQAYGRCAGVRMQPCEQYEGPSREVNAYNVENAVI